MEQLQYQQEGIKESVLLAYSGALIDIDQLNDNIIPKLEQWMRKRKNSFSSSTHIDDFWMRPGLRRVMTCSEVESKVFDGHLLMYFEKSNTAFTVDIAKHPQRQPQESNTEATIKGPKDNFIEEIAVNIALVRKRYRSNTLKCKTYELGRRTQTKIALLYDQDIINPSLVSEVDKKIKKIDVDGIISSNQIQEMLDDSPLPIFPVFEYTGRPDYVLDSLLRGRFVIFVDGSPVAILGPVNLFYLMKSPEDGEYSFIYNSFEMIIRWIAISIGVFLPGFWTALVNYHQAQIPLTFIAMLVTSREGVPFPAFLEAILMLFSFELFREAGLRLPMPIGQTLTVVGGLVIGDAAIRAGLTSPTMIVIIAVSFVATFTLVNQSLIGTLSVLRFLTLIICSFLGLIGLFISMAGILIYLANVRPFGVPYLTPLSPFHFRSFIQGMFRKPWPWINKRAGILNPKDPTRQGDSE